MSLDYSNLIAVLFDIDGTYLKSFVREISQEAQTAMTVEIRERSGNTSSSWDMNGFSKCWDDLDQWAEELGFVQGVISVKKFSLPEHELGIQDLPGVYQEMIDSGSNLLEDFQEDIQDWKEVNDYVLVWGKEYDIDQAIPSPKLTHEQAPHF